MYLESQNIPVSGKVLDKEDLRNLILSSLDLWLTAGEFTDKFEEKLRKTLDMRHCLFVNSGSSANLVAMSSLKELYKLKEGDEIITSAVNFPTTMNPIIQNGLRPVFVDAENKTYNINADLIEEKINEKTKGIVLAHTLGNPIDLEKITDICDKYDLFLMEDMCDAFGSKYKDQFVGSFGDVATLSFILPTILQQGKEVLYLQTNQNLKNYGINERLGS